MRDVLHRIRMRVDRLATGGGCDGPHALTKISFWPSGEPKPAWTPADATTCCTCGAALEYTNIIHRQDVPPRRVCQTSIGSSGPIVT